MKGDMTIPPVLPAAPTGGRPGVAGGETLKLLQPLAGLIGSGQSAQAQVLSLKQGDAAFQLLLRLTLESGRQTNVQVSSAQPLPLGTLLAVTQPAPGSLAISLQQALSSGVASMAEAASKRMRDFMFPLFSKGLKTEEVAAQFPTFPFLAGIFPGF